MLKRVFHPESSLCGEYPLQKLLQGGLFSERLFHQPVIGGVYSGFLAHHAKKVTE